MVGRLRAYTDIVSCARIWAREWNVDNARWGIPTGHVGEGSDRPSMSILDTLRIKFGRIDSSEAPNTANDRADQLALSAGMRGRVVLAKTIGARLAPLMD